MANENKGKAGTTGEPTKKAKTASEALGGMTAKTSRGDEIRIADDFSTEGFVTADNRKSDGADKDWAKLHLDRAMYKADYCAAIGGVRGYLIEIDSTMKSKEAVRDDNPEGFFDAMIVRLTAPAPVVSDKGLITKAEPGTDVIVVLNHSIKRLAELDKDPKFLYQIELLPKTKERLKNGHDLWRFEAAINLSKVERSSVNAAAALFSDKEKAKILGEGARVPVDAAKSAQAAPAAG